MELRYPLRGLVREPRHESNWQGGDYGSMSVFLPKLYSDHLYVPMLPRRED